MKEVKIKGEALREVSKHLRAGKSVKATGLGKFKIIRVKGRKMWDLKEQKLRDQKPFRRIKFSPTIGLKNALNK